MADDIRITWNPEALNRLFGDVDGPVARMLMELSEEAAMIARAVVHVRTLNPRDRRRRAGRGSSAQVPGFTKASIRTHLGRSAMTGELYGGVNAAGNAGVFLEYPAEQYDRAYPFLTTALDAIEARY